MTFGLTFKGKLHGFLAESAEIYETVLFKQPSARDFRVSYLVSNYDEAMTQMCTKIFYVSHLVMKNWIKFLGVF